MDEIEDLMDNIRALEEEIENILIEDVNRFASNYGKVDSELGTSEQLECVEQSENNNTKVDVITPVGKITVDVKEYLQASKNAKQLINPPKPSTKRRMIIHFLQSVDKSDVRWYSSRLGAMIKMHMDVFFENYTLVKEFELDSGLEAEAKYSNIIVQDNESKRYLQTGVRFYDTGEEKFVVQCSVDRDGDERIVIITAKEGRGLEIIDELENDFYENGLL